MKVFFSYDHSGVKMRTAKAVICDWFTFMLSIPQTEPMSAAQKFTQWSSLLAYCAGGFSLLVCPQLWKFLLQLEFQGRTEGYLRVIGLGVFIIGFKIVIAARSNFQDSHNVTILGSVISRLLYVNGILIMLVLRNMLPLSFALVFMALDTLLPLITLVIWCRETEGASMSLFFREVFSPILKFRGLTSGGPIAAVFSVGIFQLFFWLIFVIRPDIAQEKLQLDQFQAHSSGYLAAVFFTLSVHGWYHVTNASSANHPFVPATIFYRVALSVPVLLILRFVNQIELNLCLTLIGFDICLSILVLILVTFSKRKISNESEERTQLTHEEKD